MTADEFIHCLGATETGNSWTFASHDGRAWMLTGDAGMALGRFQWHPDAVITAGRRYNLWPKLSETWDSWFERLVRAVFASEHPETDPVLIAQYFHRGHWSYPSDEDYDKSYAERFLAAAKQLPEKP